MLQKRKTTYCNVVAKYCFSHIYMLPLIVGLLLLFKIVTDRHCSVSKYVNSLYWNKFFKNPNF